MKRRDFIKTSTIGGVSSLVGQGCSTMGKAERTSGPGFDVHPFVKNHPEAVFIHLTDVKSKRDIDDIRDTGYNLSKELIVKSSSGGYPLSTGITIKPNWTSSRPRDGKPDYEKLGINTDPNFIEGWVQAMKKAGPQKYYIRESCCPQNWEPMGWQAMCDRNDIDLREISTIDVWKLKKGRDINFIKVPGGVVFRKVGFQAPMNAPDTFLVNIAKFKSHGMGITACIKNLQGITARRFHQFCTRYDRIKRTYEKPYHKYFQKNFEKHIEALYGRHVKEGYPRWGKPGPNGGIWQETWVQRMIDSYSVTPTGLNIVEGIYGQDGNGFGIGPHEKIGEYGVTSRDYMSNMVVFGIDAFRVDNITHWLGGHEPGNLGLFHVGIERGFSGVLDPHDIPVYIWKDGEATLVNLDNFKRTPLVTYYLQRDYDGQNEPEFHLCDEPFDYSAWKEGKKVADCTPSLKELGRDAKNRHIMELNLPERRKAYVDVLNNKGEVIWRLRTDDLEPGAHQVVWDGFASPGIHNYYVKGMGWDAEKKEVIFS
jgi:uncharacterized protein (DUF362 family)